MNTGVVLDLAWDGRPDTRVHATAYLLEALAAQGPAFGVNALWLSYFRRYPGALKRHWRPRAGMLHNVVTAAAPPSAAHARAVGRALAARLRGQEGVLIWSDPDWVDALDALPGWQHVYWCTDDRVAARPERAGEVALRERRMCARASAVFAVSRVLAERLGGRLLPNGVDAPFFMQRAAAHPAVLDLPEPRVAYLGYLNDRVDWGLLLSLMRSGFTGSLVLAGGVHTRDPRLRELLRMPRVRALGWLGRSEARAVLAGCRVGLVPYVLDAFNNACHPLKMYEYLGCGLRVVSTPLPEAVVPGVLRADGDAFVDAVREASWMAPLPEAERVRVLREHSWERRAEEMRRGLGAAGRDAPGSGVDVTVAVCTRNRAALLRGALEALAGVRVPAGMPWEVVVVDNGSTDATDSVARAFATRLPLRLVREPRRGTSHARNRALDEARGGWVLFTDDDARAEPGWLEAFAEARRRHPAAAAVGGRIVPAFGAPLDPVVLDAFPMLCSGFCALDHGDVEGETDLAMFTANLAVRRGSPRFDPSLGHGRRGLVAGEDADLLRRIREGGGSTVWCPSMEVRHVVEPSRARPSYLARYCAGYAEGMARLRGTSVPARQALWKLAVNATLCAVLWYVDRRRALHRLRHAAHWYGTLRAELSGPSPAGPA